MKKLETFIVEPYQPANSAIIWLHGLGADAHDFEPIVPELNLTTTRFIFPNAPIQPVALNANYPMRAWYNIFALTLDSQEDEIGIRTSQQQIEMLLNEQIELGINSSNIALIGFSQGAAIALHTGLRFNKPLGCIAALSSYLPLRNYLANEIQKIQFSTPIFMAHGIFDTVLPILFGQVSKKFLDQLNLRVKWCEYSIDHGVCSEEISDLKNFLQETIIKSIA